MNWIAVEDKLPDVKDTDMGCMESNLVLVISNTGGMFTAKLRTWEDDNDKPQWIQFGVDGYDVTDRVTHWQNLPPPPI